MPKKPKPKPEATAGRSQLQKARPDIAWFIARLDDAGLNQLAISRRFGPSKDWFGKTFIRGERDKLSLLGEIAWLADQLKVPGTEIISRLGFRLPPALVPVVGYIDANSNVVISDTDNARVDAPPDYHTSTVALYYKGGKNGCGFVPDQLLYYSPRHGVIKVIPGRATVFETGKESFIGIADRETAGKARVTLLDGETSVTVDMRDVDAATPIDWTKWP